MGLGVRELFDNNIKVHFAGSDGGEIFYAALLAAQTKYRLFSCYKYILKCRPDDDFRLPADHVIRVQDTVNRHVIQDSGLFTLMFGAGKGQTQTLESLTEWQDKLIAFVQQNNLRCTCVELDCQKVLGVREAWYFRERMKKLLDNPQINVFHFEDGMRGLDSMIDFSDYIALSIPELRIIKPKTFREDTRYLTHYIKNRKPEIDIHLLGCTDVKMIAQNSFCTSADRDQNTCFSCRVLNCSSVMPRTPSKMSRLFCPSWGAGVRTEGLVSISLMAQPFTVTLPRVG